MSEPETVYSAREVAEAMGISGAMLRRYAGALEEITGEEIPIHRREGRQYSQEQQGVLLKAKGYVDANAGMSVDTALRLALGRAEMAVKVPPSLSQGVTDLEAFSRALEEKITLPLLEELRELRAEVVALRGEHSKALEQRDETRPGVLVRVAVRIERWLKKAMG